MKREPGLEAKVAALTDPAVYAEPARRVDTVETHMSWVFLTQAHAYKLKKSRRFDHLDFTSASARHFYCLEELRLNRRLAPGVYLDVVPLTQENDATLRIAGRGVVVDWLVKMRRLPASSMLDAMIAGGTANAAHMRRIAALMASFYAALPRAPLDGRSYRALLARHIDDDEAEMRRPEWNLPTGGIARLCDAQREFIQRAAPLLDTRVAAGRVVEGHGDLRPEHVYLGEPLAIIDALEFSAELRLVDAVDELGFLAMECERAGATSLGEDLLDAWRELTGDDAPRTLVHFYQACRAATRARLSILHLNEARYRSSPTWRARALSYLEIAGRHVAMAMETREALTLRATA